MDLRGVSGQTTRIRKGAAGAVEAHVSELGGRVPQGVRDTVWRIAQQGGTPLVVSLDARILGTIYLKDIVKGGMKDRFAHLRRMGIRTVMITGDNPMTAAAIAAEAGRGRLPGRGDARGQA